MFDKSLLKDVLIDYKKNFAASQWENEKYKWEAIKCFQDNWDVNAKDFAAMLRASLAKTLNLLASQNNFPQRMIESFAASAPEEVRAMFIKLFDENEDMYDRIKAFKDESAMMLERFGDGDRQHYQHENAITTYLWLRYPDKYYIFKYSEIKTVADALGSDYQFKKGAYANNIRNSFKLYTEINEELKQDTELVNLFKQHLTETCYNDSELKTLTSDVGFYISQGHTQKGSQDIMPNKWFPIDYNPGISADDWSKLLADTAVFTTGSLEIMKRIKDYGGQATCTQLAEKYGEHANFYNSGSVALAKRVAQKTGCPLMKSNNGDTRHWPILYLGKNANKDEEGCYIWKLRDELAEALDKTDLGQIELYTSPERDEEQIHFMSVKNIDTYLQKDFLDEVYMSEERYNSLVAVLANKKNIILQGAPGVGKTFAARRLAYSIMGLKDDQRVELIQFHQNYSYEDFVMGYKPVDNGFELKPGIFYLFCQKAANQPDKKYFFIIDEINRGNMSKIFGELLMLIEKDYRGTKATLAYNGLPFAVPKNLYIIGMMNTADRSLAMIDYALRRRFSFFEMMPGFDSEGFVQYQNGLNNETFNLLLEKIKELNKEIALDKSLGRGFCLGHSYFCGQDTCSEAWLRSVVDYDILPMLNEYWFDDPAKLQIWDNILHGVFQ